MIGKLEASPEVVGYRVGFTGASIAFAEDADVRQSLGALGIPVEWEIDVPTPAGGERWTWTPGDADQTEPAGWNGVTYG